MGKSVSHSAYWRRIAIGALVGGLATKPMSDYMHLADQSQIDSRRSSLPPRKLTLEVLKLVGLKRHLPEPQRKQAISLSHYGYGAAMGAAYAALATSSICNKPVLSGAAFGLGVWGASYWGWLPAAQSKAAAQHLSTRRNVIMAVAHLVWGITLGVMYVCLSSLFVRPTNVTPRIATSVHHPKPATTHVVSTSS